MVLRGRAGHKRGTKLHIGIYRDNLLKRFFFKNYLFRKAVTPVKASSGSAGESGVTVGDLRSFTCGYKSRGNLLKCSS